MCSSIMVIIHRHWFRHGSIQGMRLVLRALSRFLCHHSSGLQNRTENRTDFKNYVYRGVSSRDRESVFYLNVLDIPPRPEFGEKKADAGNVNYLQLAVRSRIKLFSGLLL